MFLLMQCTVGTHALLTLHVPLAELDFYTAKTCGTAGTYNTTFIFPSLGSALLLVAYVLRENMIVCAAAIR